MYAEKAITALLNRAAGVTALVLTRIHPVELPQGTGLPAVVVKHISTVALGTIDAAGYRLVASRIEVSGLAKDYPGLKNLLAQIKAACNYQRGLLGGVQVASVVCDVTGPDLSNSATGLFEQSIDFIVTLQEPVQA